jgi:hypothetical protein
MHYQPTWSGRYSWSDLRGKSSTRRREQASSTPGAPLDVEEMRERDRS